MESRETIAVLEAKLIVVGGDAKVSEVKLKLPSVIGRGASATLTLPHPLVSRRHCEIFESEGQLMVRDLGSLNGTFIGSDLITEAALPSGELLTVGTVTFRAVYGDGSDAKDQIPPNDATEKNRAAETIQVAPPLDDPIEFGEESEEVTDLGKDIEFVELDDDLEFIEDETPTPSEDQGGDDEFTEFLKSMDEGNP